MNNNKLIEAYIQMAIDNGYDVRYYERISENMAHYKMVYGTGVISTIEMITSKEFIEAIAMSVGLDFESNFVDMTGSIIDAVTIEQAIAIRDNKLPDFIQSILPKNETN